MADESFDERLKRLEGRIAAAKSAREGTSARGHAGEYTQGSLAWRMVTELVAGMALGLGIGYAIDWAAGTMPIFLVVFALLGFAAGVKTMMRTAAEVREGRGEAALHRRATPADAGSGDDKRDRDDPDEE